ncbi:MAG: dihydroorotase [Candidatus Marinimicrobia bacterium]|nr:dihydroorotase [Candidatus Neomarinimicrobiota bacterium]
MPKKIIDTSILFKNAQIVDPFKDQIITADLLIEKGKIKKIEKDIPEKEAKESVNLKGFHIIPGFIDLHVHFREPGYENSETIETGCRSALAGGFTQVCCMPNTNPAIDNRETVRFIYEKAESELVNVFPIATITKNRRGEELTEMVELAEAGAVAFSDDGSPVSDNQLFRNALEYSKITGKPIINHAEDPVLKAGGIMNEGTVSTRLGIPGNPAIAEEIMIARDLIVTEFVNGRIHIPHVSTAGSVELIRQAKAKGIAVTAEATPHHFSLTDEYMSSFNANGKVAPPLRTEKDRLAIIEGLKDGTIDAIATDHAPHVIDTKETSLDLASFGMIGLETAFSLAMTHLVHTEKLTLMELVKLLTIKPAALMNLPLPEFKTGADANITIVNTNEWWVFGRQNIHSKSFNTPFIGNEFTGRVKGVFTKGHYITF